MPRSQNSTQTDTIKLCSFSMRLEMDYQFLISIFPLETEPEILCAEPFWLGFQINGLRFTEGKTKNAAICYSYHILYNFVDKNEGHEVFLL